MSELSVLVAFGGVSIGDQTARLSCHVDRSVMPLAKADECLCGRRLTGDVSIVPADEAAGQKRFPGIEAEGRIHGTFDVKRFGVAPDVIAFGLTFSLAEINVSELARFAKRSGRLTIEGIEEIPDDEGDDECDDHPDLGPIPKSDLKARGKQLFGSDPGGAKPLSDLIAFSRDDARLTPAMIKLVATAVDGETIGHLEAMCRKWPEGWVKKIPGMGKDKITRLTDALEAFRKANPIPDDDQKPSMAEDEAEEAKEREGQSAYKQGREARLDGTLDDQNPFTGRNANHAREWNEGWVDQNRIETGEQLDEPKSPVGTIFDEQGVAS